MNIPLYVKKILKKLNDCGYEAYMVGGCVRDCLMGNEPNDYDITTNATPQQMEQCFDGFKVIPTGLKHGTLTVVSEGENVEVTTYRIDGEYADNRHPKNITFTKNLAEDLARRDFTVNAMAMDIDGNIADFYDGRGDLKNGIIKCVGDAETRFMEDGLRILRCIRFASVLGFEIEEKTAVAVHTNIHLLNNISKERIASEISKLLSGKNAYYILKNYGDVISYIIPNITFGNLGAIQKSQPDFYVRLALLFASADAAQKALSILKFDNFTKKMVKNLIKSDIHPNMSKKDIKLHLCKYGTQNFKRYLDYAESKYGKNCSDVEAEYQNIIALGECYNLNMLNATGSEIMLLGATGKQTGEILKQLLNMVISDEIPNKNDKILEQAKKILEKLKKDS